MNSCLNRLVSTSASAAEIMCIEMSHRNASVVARAHAAETLPSPCELIAAGLASEAVRVQSCNRVETYLVTSCPDAVREEFARRLGSLWPLQNMKSGAAAAKHLFRVAASLESLVVGEPQILGQIKVSEQTAIEEKTIGPNLRSLFSEARRVGRAIRSRTRLGAGNVSVASLAVRLAEKTHGSLRGKKALLIGAGEMGGIVAKSLAAAGASVTIAYRSDRARAEYLARHTGGTVCDRPLDEALAEMDVVISATSSATHVITRELVERSMSCSRRKALLLIDIAHPQDIDPEIASLSDVYLYNLDDLELVAGAHRAGRQHEIDAAETIVGEGLDRWRTSEKNREYRPLITAAYARVLKWENSIMQGAGNEPKDPKDQNDRNRRELQLQLKRIFHSAKSDLVASCDDDRLWRVQSFRMLFGI